MKTILIAVVIVGFLLGSCSESQESDNKTTNAHDSVLAPETSDKSSVAVTTDPKVFYYDYTESRGVEEALVMSKADALAEMKNLPEADGNFFGMELSDGSIVQFMYDEKKATWFLDIPNPVTQESYNADITRDEAVKIVGDVFDGKSADDIQAAYQ